MKQLKKIGIVALFAFTCIPTISLGSTPDMVQQTQLMVSIEKSGVATDQLEVAISNLNYQDLSTGTCFVASQVISYIPYDSAPYHGVAIVDFTWNCENYARQFLTNWEASGAYTVWKNGTIEPYPAVTGSN